MGIVAEIFNQNINITDFIIKFPILTIRDRFCKFILKNYKPGTYIEEVFTKTNF